ncbi:MAG: hypothetical protein ACE5JH_01190 [Acidobacteriota bacterium]
MGTRAIRALLLLAACAACLVGCDDEGDTIIMSGLDCGLVRADLNGVWRVQFAFSSRTLVNCGDPLNDNRALNLAGIPVDYDQISVFGSDESASFQVLGDRSLGDDPSVGVELIAGVEADSCLALFQAWETDDRVYVVCIGTVELSGSAPFISTFCDSAEIDDDADGTPEDTCDISSSIPVEVGIL